MRSAHVTTAVKVDDDAKTHLEELQTEIRLRTGQSVTQQELLSQLIDDAYNFRSEIIDSFRETTIPLSTAEKRRWQPVDSAPERKLTRATSTRASTDDASPGVFEYRS